MICFLIWLIGMVILFLTSKCCNLSVINFKKKLLLKKDDTKAEFFDDHELRVSSHHDDRTIELVDS